MTLYEELRSRNQVWLDDGESCYAFLVDAPISFGHSQLVLNGREGFSEEDNFVRSASVVGECIHSLRTTLTSSKAGDFRRLRRYTGSTGEYVKTCVLKASANEPRGQYKVHMVPLFSGQLEETAVSFRARMGERLRELSRVPESHIAPDEFDALKDGRGGLLYWIGTREDAVDRDMCGLRTQHSAYSDQLVQTFRLGELASELRKNVLQET